MSAIAAESSDSASSIAPCRALSFPRTQRQRNWDATSSGEAMLLADLGELGRLVVATLPVEDVGEQACRGGDVVALAHLLETPVVRAQLRLGGGQIPGEKLDDRGERAT